MIQGIKSATGDDGVRRTLIFNIDNLVGNIVIAGRHLDEIKVKDSLRKILGTIIYDYVDSFMGEGQDMDKQSLSLTIHNDNFMGNYVIVSDSLSKEEVRELCELVKYPL